jgi:hypothetical protein
MHMDNLVPLASVIIAFAAVVFTTLFMARQTREIAHERNALALLEAIDRICAAPIVEAFQELQGVHERYPTDDDLRSRYPGSADERALYVVGQYIETVACLARRGVLNASLIVDAVGLLIRTHWQTIQPFILHRRRFENNDCIYENFEWLARYSEWWKDVPRPRNDPNYDPQQFAPGRRVRAPLT